MTHNLTYFKCNICGNVVELIDNSGVPLGCCHQDMTPLTPNTVDASGEHHTPVCSIQDGLLTVTIGAPSHPMTKDHHIEWISVAQRNMTQRINLTHTDTQPVKFSIHRGNMTVYAYCNLHGLWACEETWQEAEDTIICSAEFAEGCMVTNTNDE